MNYYLELGLCADNDAPLAFLWEKLYNQLHLQLVGLQDTQGNVAVGLAFPDYNRSEAHPLGTTVRLFANDVATLEQLDTAQLKAYFNIALQISPITAVPPVHRYGCYQRLQVKSSNARLARRKAKRHGVDFEQTLTELNCHREKRCPVPYVYLHSQTTQKRFPLFIAYADCKQNNDMACFSTYGLSRYGSPVPIF